VVGRPPRQQILVVDDEPDILESVEDILRSTVPAKVLGARSGDEALQVLQREPVRLVISDFRMPGMDGCQLLRRVKVLYPDVKGLMVSAFPNPVSEQSACAGLGVELIPKPIRPDLLVEAVQEALR